MTDEWDEPEQVSQYADENVGATVELRPEARHGDYWVNDEHVRPGWYASWHPDEVYYRTDTGVWMTSHFAPENPTTPVYKLGPLYERHEQSNLVDHAQRELELLGEEHMTIDGIIRIIRAFADMGHSGGSASIVIPWLTKLLSFENLSPLTDDPAEWINHAHLEPSGEDFWQSTRRSDAFSTDGGKTYYCLNEGMVDDGEGNATRIIHGTRPHEKKED